MRRLPTVLAGFLLAGVAHAAADGDMAQWNAYLDRVGTALRASGEPRDRVLAATMFRKDAEPPPDAATLLENAARAAPDDALVQWAYLTHHAASPDACGRDGADPARLQRLAEREPDNAAAWLMLAAAAIDAGDDDGADRLLERAAASSRFDDGMIASIDAWHAVFRRLPPPFPDPSYADADPPPEHVEPAGLAFATAIMQAQTPTAPRMKPVLAACDAAAGAARDVRRYAYCAELGRRLVGAKAGLTQLFGYVLIDKSGLLTEAEATARAALQAIYDANREADNPYADAAETARILDDWRTTGGDETEVWRRRLQRAGVAAP